MKKKSTQSTAFIKVFWPEDSINGEWDVCFPGYGAKEDIA